MWAQRSCHYWPLRHWLPFFRRHKSGSIDSNPKCWGSSKFINLSNKYTSENGKMCRIKVELIRYSRGLWLQVASLPAGTLSWSFYTCKDPWSVTQGAWHLPLPAIGAQVLPNQAYRFPGLIYNNNDNNKTRIEERENKKKELRNRGKDVAHDWPRLVVLAWHLLPPNAVDNTPILNVSPPICSSNL